MTPLESIANTVEWLLEALKEDKLNDDQAYFLLVIKSYNIMCS